MTSFVTALLKRLTVHSDRCYTIATLFGDNGVSDGVLSNMAQDNDVLWSTLWVRGRFFVSMLKSTLSVVLGRSATSTYDSQYASASELPAALLKGRFEHAVKVRKVC